MAKSSCLDFDQGMDLDMSVPGGSAAPDTESRPSDSGESLSSPTRRRPSTEKERSRVVVKEELAAGGTYHLTPMGESDAPQKTTMTPLKIQMESARRTCISTLSREGFRLADNTFLWGPIAVFPKVVLSWKVLTQDDITEESLEFFTLLDPKLDIVVVGVGGREHVDSVRRRIFPFFSRAKIGLEVLPTYDAITTFNWLNADYRYIGAALFPPKKVEMGYIEKMTTMFELGSPEVLDNEFYQFGFHPETYHRLVRGETGKEDTEALDDADEEVSKELERLDEKGSKYKKLK